MPTSRWTRRGLVRTGAATVLTSLAGCLDTFQSSTPDSNTSENQSAEDSSSQQAFDVAASVPLQRDLPNQPEYLTTDSANTSLLVGVSPNRVFSFDPTGTRRWVSEPYLTGVKTTDGRFAYCGWSGSEETELVRIDLNTGAVTWRFRPNTTHEWISEVAITPDRLFLVTEQGGFSASPVRWKSRVYALNPATGQKLWKKGLPSAEGRQWKISGVRQNVVLTWDWGQIRAYGPTGTKHWQRWLTEKRPSTVESYGEMPEFSFSQVGHDETQSYVGWQDEVNERYAVEAFDVDDGAVLWQNDEFDRVEALGAQHICCSLANQIKGALDAESGIEDWSRVYSDFTLNHWGPVVNGILYVTGWESTSNHPPVSIRAIDVHTGEIIGSREFPVDSISQPVVIDEGVFVSTAMEGNDGTPASSGTLRGFEGPHAGANWE